MSARESFIHWCGSGLMGGVTVSDWFRVLKENGFRISPRATLNAMTVTFTSVLNSTFKRLEDWKYGEIVDATEVKAPVFVLGHFRSGTTHLHNLMTVDDRFTYPTMYSVMYPHTFLTTEQTNRRWMRFLLPPVREGLDNVQLGWEVPHEDEFALAGLTTYSPYMSTAFARNVDHYDRYMTFANASPAEADEWKRSLEWFLKKLTVRDQKPVVLKSPYHTGRVHLIRETFPDAKFVHIHRHPYAVYRSSQRLIKIMIRWWGLQKADAVDWSERIIRQYKEMHESLFSSTRDLPPNQFIDIPYEDLDARPMDNLEKIYGQLELPDFEVVRPALQSYLNSLKSYRKNSFQDLDEDVKKRIASEWKRSFDEWGYAA